MVDPRTSLTLLRRLRESPADQEAWREFVALYTPVLVYWSRQWGLQEADVQDVTQNILCMLARDLRTFQYDPRYRFRGWLKSVTQHALRRFVIQMRRAGKGSGDSDVLNLLNSIEAREDLVQRLEETFDQELLHLAIERVKSRVASHTWEAFRLAAVEGLSGAEVAEQLGVKIGTVFVARGRVQKLLKEETARLQEEAVGES